MQEQINLNYRELIWALKLQKFSRRLVKSAAAEERVCKLRKKKPKAKSSLCDYNVNVVQGGSFLGTACAKQRI